MILVCSLRLSLLSRVTPKNLADSDSSIVVFHTLIGLRVHFLFQVNMTSLVFNALIERSLEWHHLLVDILAGSVPDDI
jgi:hypothetical protein